MKSQLGLERVERWKFEYYGLKEDVGTGRLKHSKNRPSTTLVQVAEPLIIEKNQFTMRRGSRYSQVISPWTDR